MFCECKINHFFWNDKIDSLLFLSFVFIKKNKHLLSLYLNRGG